jgi:hypothetical protein
MPWMSQEVTPPPLGWNPYEQLGNIVEPVKAKGAAAGGVSGLEIVEIGERVGVVPDSPGTTFRVHWQIISHTEDMPRNVPA